MHYFQSCTVWRIKSIIESILFQAKNIWNIWVKICMAWQGIRLTKRFERILMWTLAPATGDIGYTRSDQWEGALASHHDPARKQPEAGNGKRGGNWKCDGQRGCGDRWRLRIYRVELEPCGNYETCVRIPSSRINVYS